MASFGVGVDGLIYVSLVIILWLLPPTELLHSFKAGGGGWVLGDLLGVVGFLHIPGVNS